jgi:hypothetical protein
MKLKVLKKFSDKHTNEVYAIGETIEVNEKRAKELLSHSLGLVEVVEEEKTVTTENVVTEQPKRKRKSN